MNMNTYPYICYKVYPILSFINDNAHYSKNKPKEKIQRRKQQTVSNSINQKELVLTFGNDCNGYFFIQVCR